MTRFPGTTFPHINGAFDQQKTTSYEHHAFFVVNFVAFFARLQVKTSYFVFYWGRELKTIFFLFLNLNTQSLSCINSREIPHLLNEIE